MSITGKNMKTPPFVSQEGFLTDIFIFLCIISFSVFIHYACMNVTRERKRMKDLMTMMGLQNSAFWWVKYGTDKCRNSGTVSFLKAALLKPNDFLTSLWTEQVGLGVVNAWQVKAGGNYCFLTEGRTSGLSFLGDCKAGVIGDGHWVYQWVWQKP